MKLVQVSRYFDRSLVTDIEREEEGALVLANCPFDSLAREHTALVCSQPGRLAGYQ